MKGIFVAGTDTGVGKTYIACIISGILKNNGINVGVMKPACSGSRSDVKKLLKAAGIRENVELVNPLYFKHPLAPYVSARLERKKVDVKKALTVFRKLCSKYDFLVVEGAGGVQVPITEKYFVSDMIKNFGLPVILVARPALGTINHTLLAMEKLERMNVKVAAVVLSNGRGRGPAERTNPAVLRKLAGLTVFEIKNNERKNMEFEKWLLKTMAG